MKVPEAMRLYRENIALKAQLEALERHLVRESKRKRVSPGSGRRSCSRTSVLHHRVANSQAEGIVLETIAILNVFASWPRSLAASAAEPRQFQLPRRVHSRTLPGRKHKRIFALCLSLVPWGSSVSRFRHGRADRLRHLTLPCLPEPPTPALQRALTREVAPLIRERPMPASCRASRRRRRRR
jgi:hypothetical protein